MEWHEESQIFKKTIIFTLLVNHNRLDLFQNYFLIMKLPLPATRYPLPVSLLACIRFVENFFK